MSLPFALKFDKSDTIGKQPPARGGHSAVFIEEQLIVFGGHYYGGSGNFHYLNSVEVFDVKSGTWSGVKTSGIPPTPRYGHSASLIGSKMYVFGGKGENGRVYQDIHSFDLVTCSWSEVQCTTALPQARFGHGAASSDRKIFIVGGWDGRETFGCDLCVFDSQNSTWSYPATSGNPPSSRHGLALELYGPDKLVVFGGYTVEQGKLPVYNGDSRMLNLKTMEWTRWYEHDRLPRGRFGHQALVLESFNHIVYVGGWDGTKDKLLCTGSDSPTKSTPYQTYTTDVVTAYNMEKMTWKPAACTSQRKVANRYGHTITKLNDIKYLMYGGWDGNRASAELLSIEIVKTKSETYV